MAKAELGVKRRCLKCETLFFDLNRAPPACPKCQAVFEVVEPVRSPPRRAMSSWNTFKRPDPATTVVDDLPPIVGEGNDTIVPTDEDERLPELA